MPDVGILNLQIHDNSDKVAPGLRALAGALDHLKTVVGTGFKLSGIGANIKKIADAVNANLSGTTFERISRLGDALNGLNGAGTSVNFGNIASQIRNVAKTVNDNITPDTISVLSEFSSALAQLKGLGDININIKAASQIAKVAESIKETGNAATQMTSSFDNGVDHMADKVSKINDEFMRLRDSIQEVNQLIEQTSWQFGAMAEKFSKAFATMNRMRMARSLGTGESPLPLGPGGVAPENALSTNVDYSQQWMPDWSNNDQWKPDWTFVDEVQSKAELVKMALEEIERMKSQLLHDIESGSVGKEDALKRAQEIQELEDKIPYVAEIVQASMAKIAHSMTSAAHQAKDEWLGTYESAMEYNAKINGEIAKKYKKPELTFEEYYGPRAKGIFAPEMTQEAIDASVVEAANKYNMTLAEARERLYALRDAAEQTKPALDMSNMPKTTSEAFETFGANLPSLTSTLTKYKDILREVGIEQKDAAGSAGGLGRVFDTVKDGIKRMFPTLTGMIKRFGQIAKYRALRYVLKAITSGLSEGIKNVYQYSSAINGHFAAAMDNAASSLLLMKNSLGAAAAPLVEMLIPYLQQVVNWFVNLLNYANQFFALLNGQSSWTRAVPTTTKAFGNQEKAAKGASNAIKDLLADWDELNINQSESGKGAWSGASGSAENYLEMFEEVGKFNNKVRDVVDYIQENIGSILTDVGLIAAAILGWKLSGAFAGVLGTIGAIAGTVATFAVVFDVSKQFNTKFLDTGEPGYLVADLLTTMLGGLATKALISKVLGTAAGTVAFGLTFAVSAAAGIIANVASTDVSTLSQKSIVSSIVTALKGWAAVTAAGKGLFNLGLGEAAANGAIGALATFAVAIGIKADAQVSKEGLDEETIGAKLLSVLGLAATGAAIAAKTGADIEGVAGMAMLFGGAPITTLGIAVGIHAINKVVDAREITSEVIGENLVAGGLIGLGLGISSAAVVGGTLGTIIGTGGAALAIGALFAIEAYIVEKPIKVVWGNYDATKEEIEDYIESYFYSTPPSVTINTIKASIKDVTDASETLGNDMSDLLGTLDVLHLGLDPSTPDDVRTQIQKLVSSYNNATQKYQNLLQVAVTLTPVSKVGEDGTEQDISSGIVQNSKNRWDVLNNEMTRLGEELADTYKVAYNARLDGNVDEIAEQTIKELSGMMSDIAAAIATGQTKAKVGHVLKEQIKNLSQESMHDFLQMYREQREALIKELMDARGKAAEGLLAQAYSFEDLAEKALERAGGNTADATYQRYKELAKEAYDDYEAAMENVRKDAETAADNLIDSKEKDKIRETLLGNIKTVINTKDMEEVFGLGGVFDTNKFSKYITDRLITGSLGEGEAKARAEEARGSFESFMNELLVELVGEDNFADYREAIDNNLIKWGDLFPADFASKIFESFNLNDVPEAERNNVQKKLAEIINSIFGNGTVSAPEPVVDTTEVQNTATEIMDQVQEAVDNAGSVKVGVEPEIKATANPEIVSEIFSLFKKTSFLPNFTEMFEEGLEELDLKYGVDEVDKALEESGVLKNYYGITIPLKFELDENSQNIVDMVNELKQNDGTSGNAGSPILGRFSTSQLTASTGYSDSNVGNARTRLSGEETTYTQTADPAGEKQRIQEGVETGVRKGNADQNQLLQQAVNLLLQIARKDFTVNVTPNSSWGRFGSQSNEYYERVGGETVSKW